MNIGKFHYWHSVIIIFLCFNCLYLKSNDTITVHRNNLLFSFSNVHIEDDYLLQDNMISLQLEYNLNLKDYLSVGCNAGFGLYEEWLFERDSTSISITYLDVAKSFQYGLNSNLYILPLIFETKIPRFDLYISGELGLVSLFSSKVHAWKINAMRRTMRRRDFMAWYWI